MQLREIHIEIRQRVTHSHSTKQGYGEHYWLLLGLYWPQTHKYLSWFRATSTRKQKLNALSLRWPRSNLSAGNALTNCRTLIVRFRAVNPPLWKRRSMCNTLCNWNRFWPALTGCYILTHRTKSFSIQEKYRVKLSRFPRAFDGGCACYMCLWIKNLY